MGWTTKFTLNGGHKFGFENVLRIKRGPKQCLWGTILKMMSFLEKETPKQFFE